MAERATISESEFKLGTIQPTYVHAALSTSTQTHTQTQTQRRTSLSLGAERNTTIFVLLWQQVHLSHIDNSATSWENSINSALLLQSHRQRLCRDFR